MRRWISVASASIGIIAYGSYIVRFVMGGVVKPFLADERIGMYHHKLSVVTEVAYQAYAAEFSTKELSEEAIL